MRHREGARWNADGRHAWLVYETPEGERTVLQDTENDRAWLESSVIVPVTP